MGRALRRHFYGREHHCRPVSDRSSNQSARSNVSIQKFQIPARALRSAPSPADSIGESLIYDLSEHTEHKQSA